jgi:hypothetical protein
MSESLPSRTKAKTVRLYAAGIVAFTGIFGLLTLTVLFLSHVKT